MYVFDLGLENHNYISEKRKLMNIARERGSEMDINIDRVGKYEPFTTPIQLCSDWLTEVNLYNDKYRTV